MTAQQSIKEVEVERERQRLLAVMAEQEKEGLQRSAATKAALKLFRVDPFHADLDYASVAEAIDDDFRNARLKARDIVIRAMAEHRHLSDFLRAANDVRPEAYR